MADRYRPDRHRSRSRSPVRRVYQDLDDPDPDSSARRDDRYGGERSGERARRRRPQQQPLNYESEGVGDASATDEYRRVNAAQHHFYTRSDDLSYDRWPSKPHNSRYERRVYTASPVADGESDRRSDENPCRFVLVRGLTKAVEHTFAKGMEKLYDGHGEVPGGVRPNSVHRVFIIRDRESNRSVGFGFAEFFSVSDAKAAINKERKLGPTRNLTIESHAAGSFPITVSFAHDGIFMPAGFDYPPEDDPKVLITVNGGQYRYRDRRCYASELVVNPEPPASSSDIPMRDAGEETEEPVYNAMETEERAHAEHRQEEASVSRISFSLRGLAQSRAGRAGNASTGRDS